jgi:protein Tex
VEYSKHIASLLDIRSEQVSAAIELFDEGNTIPFIARYRKEKTSSLDEEQLRQIETNLDRLRALEERRAVVIASIDQQGKLTAELNQMLLAAVTQTELEDLYQPYKPKRRTRASVAREKGLQPLADMILAQPRSGPDPQKAALAYISEEVLSVDDALAGACDIVAEVVSDHSEVRQQTREKALQWGVLRSEKIKDASDPRQVYQMYYEADFRVDRLRPHQVLAINRGEQDKILRVRIIISERDWRGVASRCFRADTRSLFCDLLNASIADGAERLLLPAIERDVRRMLTEQAETHAIAVFSANLRALLSQPPLEGQVVLGLDPGFRTGCKVAVVDGTGKVLDTGTIYPHEPQRRWDESLKILKSLVERYGVTLIAIGNGTASRETEKLAAELIGLVGGLHYLIASEAGASVYSASPLARAELPALDVSLRGAVSIARRVQDPLAELVKIDPKSIGVGLYQHDVNQNQLASALDGVVESVVNHVGVEVNTASPALLTHISGIGSKLAERIVAYREANGAFQDRKSLTSVGGLGAKAFEQAAGFLRIRSGKNPLDASAIHPESYAVAEAVITMAGINLFSGMDDRRSKLDAFKSKHDLQQLAMELNTGIPTLEDIFEQLLRPGRDPRHDLPAPVLRSDVLSMDDLVKGMRLKGTVRNVVDFGAFVDIGVKSDGLLHRSQFPHGLRLQVGDVIDVEIASIEVERGRIALHWPYEK